jgi:predicted SAM-dependent methyltransferase
LPFADRAYDLVCAFQMLEHLPYGQSLAAFGEMARVARRHVVISLPDARGAWRYVLHVPRIGVVERLFERPVFGLHEHRFDGEHHWEVNKRGYGLQRIVADLSRHAELLKTYRVSEMPYHRFFVFRRR